MRRLTIRILTAAYFAAVCAPFADAQTTLDDTASEIAERRFVRQLAERRLFSLARQRIQNRLQQSKNSDRKARWQLQQAELFRRHAWYLDTRSRTELLRDSIAQLSDFLNERVPSLEYNLQIRFEIARTLADSMRMAIPPLEAGHLFGTPTPTASADAATAHQASLQQAAAMVDAALDHLEQNRADIERDLVSLLRREGRFLQAQIASLSWRFESNGDRRRAAADRAAQLWLPIQRSARDPDQQTAAGLMLAELSIMDDRSAEFDLRIRTAGTAGTDSVFGRPAFLTTRRLLRDRNPEAALDAIRNAEPINDVQLQHQQWLQLECLLGLFDAALQLNDDRLQDQTANQFRQQLIVSQRTCRGVFWEATVRTNDRYELLKNVGPEVADLMEQIDQLQAAGQPDEALRSIDLALQRLSPSNTGPAKGALLFKAGQLLVQQNNFDDAANQLDSAVAAFTTAELPSRAAAADLLKIFCTARQLELPNPQIQLADYQRALTEHLQQFGDQPSADQAAEWLQKLLAATDPLAAVQLALDRYDAATKADNKDTAATQLNAAGRQLVSLLARHSAATSELTGFDETRQRFLTARKQAIESSSAPSQQQASAMLSGIVLTLARDAEQPDWTELQTLLQQLASHQDALRTEPTDRFSLALSLAIVNARTDAESPMAAEALPELQSSGRMEQLIALHVLGQQLQGTIRRGNGELTRLAVQLLQNYLNDLQSSDESVAALIPVASQLAVFSRRPDLLRQVLNETSPVTADGSNLPTSSDVIAALGRQTQLVAQDPGVTNVVLNFWQQVLNQAEQGTDHWLEAALQRATLLLAGGQSEQAIRQLQLVQTLYPDWGSDSRRRQADRLLQEAIGSKTDRP